MVRSIREIWQLYQDGRNVIRPSSGICGAYQSLAGAVWRGGGLDDAHHFILRHQAPEAIRTQQKVPALGYGGGADIGSEWLSLTQRTVEHISLWVNGGFLFGQMAQLHHALHQRMIAGEDLDLSLTIDSISPAVAHVSDRHVLIQDQHSRQGCPASRRFFRDRSVGGHNAGFEDFLNSFFWRGRVDIHETKHDFLDHLSRHNSDRQTACDLSMFVPTHSVGNDEQTNWHVTVLVREKRGIYQDGVFVVIAKSSYRLSAPGDQLWQSGLFSRYRWLNDCTDFLIWYWNGVSFPIMQAALRFVFLKSQDFSDFSEQSRPSC